LGGKKRIASFAEANGTRDVFYGAHSTDAGVPDFWDCTLRFVECMNEVFGLNEKYPVFINAPFLLSSKSTIIQLGVELGVDFAHTWSCYNSGMKHCGYCLACKTRMKSFIDAGVPDPTEYGKDEEPKDAKITANPEATVSETQSLKPE
jgi:7-cyano-7-deazaguanine synthase